eukprot:1943595-Pyramimonas_sp.AAC.1
MSRLFDRVRSVHGSRPQSARKRPLRFFLGKSWTPMLPSSSVLSLNAVNILLRSRGSWHICVLNMITDLRAMPSRHAMHVYAVGKYYGTGLAQLGI